MGFYEQIAPYYDYIFPAGREQLEFIREEAGNPPKRLLDIACGTAEYSIPLAQDGYNVTAVDIDEEMVRRARIKAAGKNVQVNLSVSDMLNLDKKINGKFDCVFCIGNSIVHLGGREAILAALLQMKAMLQQDGSLILQIINFDRIFEKGITALPSIINEGIGLEFYRKYIRAQEEGLIYFDTELIIKNESKSEKYDNRIKLFPLLSSDFMSLLTDAGFSEISFYGGFNKEAYIKGESYLLVVRAC